MKKQGVLLVNLGSPDSPSVPDVRRYLREFLMDPRVLDTPYPIRFFVVNALILPSRPKQSGAAYQSIWWPEGSPLVVLSKRLQGLLQKRVQSPVALAMRYQNPSIPHAVESLVSQGVDEVVLVPLFPHYAMSSFETAVERVREVLNEKAPTATLKVVPPFYDDPAYIEALVTTAGPYLKKGFDHLLFSFHGLPERHMRKADPTGRHCVKVPNCCEVPSPAHATCYRAQCLKTTAAFVRRAKLAPDQYSISFQSRLGREPWLTPYTDKVIEELPNQGKKRLLVICPAFVSDCLETLEEIGERGRESFLHAGGKEFDLIPCLNEQPKWVDALVELVGRQGIN
ncbi:MAG: ferrochelatase [Pedosphaera sp.]|nr:ferrochelatase [Pedosphaera sp.]